MIPLTLREATPPSDVIPALRPQLTGPVVGATVDSILDTIRHEKMSAVGIIATDDRDVLFLAREVKRASPDVQLFLFGTHGLYLHPDYVPDLRGALVASSYALTLANQPEIPGGGLDRLHRQPFPSMSAQGVYYAAHTLVSLGDTNGTGEASLPYCSILPAAQTCVPVAPASISVVGEDAYWTLPDAGGVPPPPLSVHQTSTASTAIPAPSTLHAAPLPPIPPQFLIGGVLLLVIVAVHLRVVVTINRSLGDPKADPSFFEWPLVRPLVPLRDERWRCRPAPLRAHGLFRAVITRSRVGGGGPPAVPPAEMGWMAGAFAVAATWLRVIYTGVKCYEPRRMPPAD